MQFKLPELESVIRGLHGSDIRVGFQTHSGGITVWITDRLYRVREECVFDDANPAATSNSVAQWLHSTALHLFPDSDYAFGRQPHDGADHPHG
jgi:hypothetical protein